MTAADPPELLPARMLNEFVYCPRLFYLEWVDNRWAANDDTAEGALAHRRVDTARGSLPDDIAEWVGQATSVQLSSDRLGIIAVIDRVDTADGEAKPVDIKKGRAAPDGQPWPADRAQLIAQAMLLREHGWSVRSGSLFYAETRERVDVTIDNVACGEVAGLVAAARSVAAAQLAPPPLVDSPKCPRCSLVGLCLPDETNLMLGRAEQPPRRIVPRDPDHRPLYVTEQGAAIGVRDGRVRVTRSKEVLADIRLIDVSQLCLHGNVQISAQALGQLWFASVPVLWFTYGGWLRGWASGEPGKYVELRRRQVAVCAQGAHPIACRMIEGKIRNSRTLLRRNTRGDAATVVDSLGRLAGQAAEAANPAALLGFEGTAARLYFERFTGMIAAGKYPLVADFDANGRTRRPPLDIVNCLLGYTYSLLLKDIVAACIGVGLDPYLGVLHRPRYGRPALALDIAEEFRPLLAESTVVQLLNNGEIDRQHFMTRSRGVSLTPDGRRRVIAAYERRLQDTVTHPVFRYKISYRRVIDVQTRVLAAVIVGELPEYIPMTTR